MTKTYFWHEDFLHWHYFHKVLLIQSFFFIIIVMNWSYTLHLRIPLSNTLGGGSLSFIKTNFHIVILGYRTHSRPLTTPYNIFKFKWIIRRRPVGIRSRLKLQFALFTANTVLHVYNFYIYNCDTYTYLGVIAFITMFAYCFSV